MKSIIFIIIVVYLSIPVAANAGIRCKTDIISEGDRKHVVSAKIKKCGKVLSKEVMQSSNTDSKQEEWLVKVRSWCYPVLFVNGVLRDVGDSVKCR